MERAQIAELFYEARRLVVGSSRDFTAIDCVLRDRQDMSPRRCDAGLFLLTSYQIRFTLKVSKIPELTLRTYAQE